MSTLCMCLINLIATRAHNVWNDELALINETRASANIHGRQLFGTIEIIMSTSMTLRLGLLPYCLKGTRTLMNIFYILLLISYLTPSRIEVDRDSCLSN